VEWVQFWQQVRELSPLAREREDVARARILLAQKMPTEALLLLEALQVSAEKQERWSHVIEMQVLQALAHSLLGKNQTNPSRIA
jgi:hypothetical protein